MNRLFKSKKDIEAYFDGDKIECLLCHRMLKAVGGRHLACAHGITVEEYKIKFGLPMGVGLVCSDTAKKQGDALKRRIDNREPSLSQINPEILKKRKVAKKSRGHPPYHISNMKKYAKKGRKILQAKSEERILNIDWDEFLKLMKKNGDACWNLRGKNGIPSDYDIKRKLESDKDFNKKYYDLIDSFKIMFKFKEKIHKFSDGGFSHRAIAKKLNISKTHVTRILKDNKKGEGEK